VDIVKATASFEAWLAARTPLVAADVERKHRLMADATNPFPFFRGTFYRWSQRWLALGGDLCDAPPVLAVGDIHVENFGTWRDAEGRLAWGVNDFDEAGLLPYTNDLVRLAASAALAARQDRMSLSVAAVCDAVLHGYRTGLKRRRDGLLRPTLVDGDKAWLAPPPPDPHAWWRRMKLELAGTGRVPREAGSVLRSLVPDGARVSAIGARVAGVGSLGKRRFAIVAEWHGGPVAREVKALVPSALCWARDEDRPPALTAILRSAVRSPDPHFQVCGEWVCRRVAPDMDKAELNAAPGTAGRLLETMGRALACVHADDTADVLADLADRPRRWLRKGVNVMLDDVLTDWKAWCGRAGSA
jgi:hypothetical protein